MKKLFLIISILLLSATSYAGGLFSGCYSSGFGTHSWRADTEAYISRVEADGGTVINEQMVNDAYQLLADYSLTPIVWVDANFGVKKDGSNLVAKLYDISDNDHDAVQATGANQPFWNDAEQNGLATIQFNGSDEWLEEGTNLGKPASFTAFTIFKASNITSRNVIWMNRTGSYSWWGAEVRNTANGDIALIISDEANSRYTTSTSAASLIGTTDYYLRTDRYVTGSSTTIYNYLDGGSALSTTITGSATKAATNAGTSLDFRIGRYGNDTTYYTGYVGSLCIFDSSLSDANRGYVRDFLNSKYATY